VITSTPANHYRDATRIYQTDILKTVIRLSYITFGIEIKEGVRFPAVVREFSLLHRLQTDSGADPVGTVSSFPGLNWPEHEADHSSLSNAEVKNSGAVPPLPNKI
jgi:hypothetical protein